VIQVGNEAFSYCSNITSITIPNSVIIIGKGAFEGCTNISNVEISDSVTSIEEQAFCNCTGLKSITVPDSVTSIGANAFGYSCLDSIVILNPQCQIAYDYISSFNSAYKEYFGEIKGFMGSTVEEHAKSFGFRFVAIENGLSITSLGDVNEDGKVDAKDASFILGIYSILSTGGTPDITEGQAKAADVNNDGHADSKDASTILSYYSYISTGGTNDLETFLKS
jgi:hypothetical protein